MLDYHINLKLPYALSMYKNIFILYEERNGLTIIGDHFHFPYYYPAFPLKILFLLTMVSG